MVGSGQVNPHHRDRVTVGLTDEASR